MKGDFLITTSEPHIFDDGVGRSGSHCGASSRRLIVMNRHSGEVLWDRDAQVGFRHNGIASSGDNIFVVDGLPEQAMELLARRGEEPNEKSEVISLDLETGDEIWRSEGQVYGDYLLYSEEHDILVRSGTTIHQVVAKNRERDHIQDKNVVAFRGEDGEIVWEREKWTSGHGHAVLNPGMPAALWNDMLIPAKSGTAISIKTGENIKREQPLTGQSSDWYYHEWNCGTINASKHMLTFRESWAAFQDMEHDTGMGHVAGRSFRSGCTPNLIAADGVLSALDYSRTCICSYALQTSLAMVHMPEETNAHYWTSGEGAFRNPEKFGLNFGAPGRRVDAADSGRIWYDREGDRQRHPSKIADPGDGGLEWVAAFKREGEGEILVEDLLGDTYAVRLHFAELDEDVEAGERVFNVYIDGEKVLDEYDIVNRSGANLRGVVEEFEAEVSGDSLTLELRRAGDSRLDPVISGLDVERL